jgi:hypothetical protein
MTRAARVAIRGLAFAALLAAGPAVGAARAEGGDAGATWRLEQPLPPELPSGQKSTIPIGLGRVGDIEFWAPNRGLLITAGNPPTIPPGVWAYNGVGWHELASVCGASDGRIAWAGPDEFWTVSDGRPGQSSLEGVPPLEDNTLCHFAGGEVVGSYASLAFRPDSYQAMHGAGCVGASNCWFGGEPLPEGQAGAFHLHWDGHSLIAEPNPQGHAVEDVRRLGNELFESVRIKSDDALSEAESQSEPFVLRLLEPTGVQPRFLPLSLGVPFYAAGEFPQALDFLRLSSDATALWGAANPAAPTPEGSIPGEATVIRVAGGSATQIIGPTTDPEGVNPFTSEPGVEGARSRNQLVNSIAAEPPGEGEGEGEGTAAGESAWLALASGEDLAAEPLANARVARLSSGGAVSERDQLPGEQEAAQGVGPKGVADKVACPAPHDCWLATRRGWLFHLTTDAARRLEVEHPDTDPAFSKAEPITFRPPDAGVPALVPDAPPVDDSGLLGEIAATNAALAESSTEPVESRVKVPLLSRIRSRLVHGTTLELRFHLAAKARVRLLAKRRKRVVARTPMRTFAAGDRKLLLELARQRWPTSLDLQSHALAPLPTVSTRGSGTATDTVGTDFAKLPQKRVLDGPGSRW